MEIQRPLFNHQLSGRVRFRLLPIHPDGPFMRGWHWIDKLQHRCTTTVPGLSGRCVYCWAADRLPSRETQRVPPVQTGALLSVFDLRGVHVSPSGDWAFCADTDAPLSAHLAECIACAKGAERRVVGRRLWEAPVPLARELFALQIDVKTRCKRRYGTCDLQLPLKALKCLGCLREVRWWECGAAWQGLRIEALMRAVDRGDLACPTCRHTRHAPVWGNADSCRFSPCQVEGGRAASILNLDLTVVVSTVPRKPPIPKGAPTMRRSFQVIETPRPANAPRFTALHSVLGEGAIPLTNFTMAPYTCAELSDLYRPEWLSRDRYDNSSDWADAVLDAQAKRVGIENPYNNNTAEPDAPLGG